MKFMRKSSPALVATLVLLFALSGLSFGKSKNSSFPDIKISNFGQLDENFYRGARPKPEELKTLAALGIKTIIDLTDNTREREEPAAIAAGLRYVNIAIEDKTNPSEEQINTFLKIANDPATGKFYVHCAGGRHRTGVMAAVYRFNHSRWNYDQAYAEMKQYDFYTSNGHGKQLDFVQNYWQEFQAKQANAGTAVAAGR